jgi:hypothetical protein
LVDIHTHAASAITSGVFDFDRIQQVLEVEISGTEGTPTEVDLTTNIVGGNLHALVVLLGAVSSAHSKVVLPALGAAATGKVTVRVNEFEDPSANFVQIVLDDDTAIFPASSYAELDADEELTFRWNNGRWDLDLRPNPFATTTAFSIFKPNASGTLALTSDLPISGTKTYAFFAATGSNQPPATNFAVLDTRNSISVLEFRDTTADDAAIFVGVMPEAAVLSSGLKVRIHWMSDTEISGDVRWQAHFQRCDTGTDLDSDSFDANASNEATGTASATLGAPTITEITCGSGAIDGIVAGDAYRLRITREQSDSTNDTMTCVAQVFAVEVRSAA